MFVHMINKKEKVKNEMKEELNKIVDKYVEEMDNESNKDKFPIDVIEEMLGKIISDSKKVIVDKTEELVNNIEEEEEINKKK